MPFQYKHRLASNAAALPRARIGAVGQFLWRQVLDEQDRWFLWLPVFLGSGIGIYFLFPFEPSLAACLLALLLALSPIVFIRRSHPYFPAAVALAALFAGLALVKMESDYAATPRIEAGYGTGMVEGRLVKVEAHLAPDADRWTIVPSFIEGISSNQLPELIRLSVRPEYKHPPLRAGEEVRVKAALYPLPGPVEPHGFNFARQGWFAGLGGIGAVIEEPIVLRGDDTPSFSERLDRLRNTLAARIYQQTGSQSGAIAAALIVGARGYIPDEAYALLRDTGLAHIIAISGLHMACFAGALFFLARLLLVLFTPGLALRYPIKQWALAPAIPGAVIYLIISGGAIATQRAFLMFLIVALAVLASRPVLTMRNVALAALAILIVSPSSLMGASFQMSFAATMAIIAAYETIPAPHRQRRAGRVGRLWDTLWRAGFTLFLTSLAAWAVTGLLGAWHFNRVAGIPALAANMLVLPIFTIFVMPSAAAALALMPFGMEWLALAPMQAGLDVILYLAELCATYLGRAQPVPAPNLLWALAAVAGVIWFCLWKQTWRHAGLGLVLLALCASVLLPAQRPDLLIDRQGRLAALRDEGGQLWLSNLPRNPFIAERWLRSDGDSREVGEAYDDSLFICSRTACRSAIEGRPVVVVIRNRYAPAEKCAGADIVISRVALKHRLCTDAPLFLGPDDFASGGAHAVYFTPEGARVENAADFIGERPWGLALQ